MREGKGIGGRKKIKRKMRKRKKITEKIRKRKTKKEETHRREGGKGKVRLEGK